VGTYHMRIGLFILLTLVALPACSSPTSPRSEITRDRAIALSKTNSSVLNFLRSRVVCWISGLTFLSPFRSRMSGRPPPPRFDLSTSAPSQADRWPDQQGAQSALVQSS